MEAEISWDNMGRCNRGDGKAGTNGCYHPVEGWALVAHPYECGYTPYAWIFAMKLQPWPPPKKERKRFGYTKYLHITSFIQRVQKKPQHFKKETVATIKLDLLHNLPKVYIRFFSEALSHNHAQTHTENNIVNIVDCVIFWGTSAFRK